MAIKLGEHRSNLRFEHERLTGESHLIPGRRAVHDDRVADFTAAFVKGRQKRLKQLYKELELPMRHPIES